MGICEWMQWTPHRHFLLLIRRSTLFFAVVSLAENVRSDTDIGASIFDGWKWAVNKKSNIEMEPKNEPWNE